MTEQQLDWVKKLYSTVEKACRLDFNNLSLSFFYNLQNICQSFVIHNTRDEYKNEIVEELYNKILRYIEYNKEPKLETFIALFEGV